MRLRLVSKATLLFCLATAGVGTYAQDSAKIENADRQLLESISHQIQDVFQRSHGAVVKILAEDRHGRLSGTGFFIDPVGTIYTSYSIGGEAHSITVEVGDKKYTARRLLADARSGIAILKVEAETPFLKIGSSKNLKVASPVVAIGYPMDLDASPNFGTVAGFDRRYLGRYFPTSHIRVNIPVQRGQGGSPLLNLNDEVIGVLVSGVDGGAVCYVLPIDAAEKVRSDFVRFGEVRHGWMGLTVVERLGVSDKSSVVVQELAEAGPSLDAGLQPGDVLLQIGKTSIRTPADVLDASFFLTAGDEVEIAVERNGERHSFKTSAGDQRRLQARRRPVPKGGGVTLEGTVE